PLGEYLRGLGARLHTGTPVGCVSADGDSYVVTDASGTATPTDGVVIATDVSALQSIVAKSPQLGDPPWRARIETMGTAAPFLVQRLWLDRPVRDDRPAFLGTGGLPPLDNISVLNRYEHEATAWAER
ncbi:isorenieratene synthase, partial [Mycobacterium sp. ITM-2017-0098]